MVSALIRGIRACLPSQWRGVRFIAILLFRHHFTAQPLLQMTFFSRFDFFWPPPAIASRTKTLPFGTHLHTVSPVFPKFLQPRVVNRSTQEEEMTMCYHILIIISNVMTISSLYQQHHIPLQLLSQPRVRSSSAAVTAQLQSAAVTHPPKSDTHLV